MPKKIGKSGSGLFVVDHSDEDRKVDLYLLGWTEIARADAMHSHAMVAPAGGRPCPK